MKRATKRILNRAVLAKWIEQHAPRGKEKLVAGCNFGFTVEAVTKWLQRGNAPVLRSRLKIVKFTSIPMDTLFPEVPNK